MIPRALGVIPARIASSRLPRKPLVMLAGRPLIEWVWRRVVEADLFEKVVIATDSEEVARAGHAFGAHVEITDPDHASGTDRVAEVAAREAFATFSVIVNIQGDEPLVRVDDLRVATELVRSGRWEIGTVAAPVRSTGEWRDPAVVKVVRDSQGGALLFSRAPIPFARDSEPTPADLASGLFLRHVGIYAYRRGALLRWVALPEGELERIERLEQLRPLAAGMAIGVGVIEALEHGGVDTPADVRSADRILREQQLTGATVRA